MPTGVVLLSLLFGLLLRRRWLIGWALLVFWLASLPVVSESLARAAALGDMRQLVGDAPAVDAIVVLSGGGSVAPAPDRVDAWRGTDRVLAGVALYRAGKARWLMFTGGWVPWQPDAVPEGDANMVYARSLGLPSEAMLTTGRVAHTGQEAEAVSARLAEMGLAKGADGAPRRPHVLVVTSPDHMERARFFFSQAGMDVSPFVVGFHERAAYVPTMLDFVPRASAFAQTEGAWRELCGRWIFRLGHGFLNFTR